VLWVLACLAVLALTVWAAHRALRTAAVDPDKADASSMLALICVAMFGLVVSPVSWSHHWVWALPTLLVTAITAYRRRNALLTAVTVAGMALMIWTPITLMSPHHETAASLWRQLAGCSYVWWALAVIVVTGLTSTTHAGDRTGNAAIASYH
jgi:alpha-1,2-mannosyltransferase